MTVTLPLFHAYVQALREHAHQLIAEGYERLDKTSLGREKEPDITGELVREMRAFLESEDATEDWVTWYSIHDDPPTNDSGQRGSSRPRVDVEFERLVQGKRPRLRFEAKRLCSATKHTASGYLGDEGLGCFLSGKYRTTHGEAGMLGYVQDASKRDETAWAEEIGSHLDNHHEKLRAQAPWWTPQQICSALAHTYVSRHRLADGDVVVHHVLLRFGPELGGCPDA